MTFEQWLQSLTSEQRYDFDSEGRGYKKDASVMMRLAWDAAVSAEREACAALAKGQGGGQWCACAERKPADLTMCAFVTSDGKLRVGGYSAACGGFREADADSGTWNAVYWLLLPPVRMPDGWGRSNVFSTHSEK